MQTTLRATSIGQVAYGTLESLKVGSFGEIVNCFSNSFYIRTPDEELVFVTSRHLKSPVTVNLDSTVDFEHSLKPLDRAFFEQSELRVGDNLTIDLTGAPICASQADLSALRVETLREVLYVATAILAIVDTYQSVLDDRSLAYDGANQFVLNGILPLRDSNDTELFRKTAEGIVGLGVGFTPSADDVLAGFLATYNSLAPAAGRPKILLDFELLKKNTGWISAKLLDYMQRGVVDDQVAHLIRSVGSEDKDEFVIALESLLPRGHTSGVDIAVGSVLAVTLLLDVANNGYETEAIIRRLGLSC